VGGGLDTITLPQARPPALRPRALRLAAGLAGSAGCGYLAVRHVDLGATWAAIRAAAPLWLVPSAAALGVAVLLRAARWRALFASGSRPDLRAALSAYLVGQFFNNVLPFRAGEAARVVALARRTRGSAVEVTATVAVERVVDVLSLLALLFVFVPWYPPIGWLGPAAAVAVAIACALGLVVVVLARCGDRGIETLLRPLGRLPRVDAARVAGAAGAAGRGLVALRSPRVAAESLGLTVASWVVMAASFWFLARAFGLHVSLLAGVLVVVATNLGQVVPSSPAALGVFEAATVLALGVYGVHRPEALPYALALHALNLVPYLAAGPFALRHTPVASLPVRARNAA